MSNEITNFLTKYTSLPEEQIEIIAKSIQLRTYPKGAILLKEGEMSNECYMIFRGCIRSYILKDGEEKTVEFYTEEQPVAPVNFGTNKPSELYFECVEETSVCVGTAEQEQDMFAQFPELESACRVMAEKTMARYQTAFTAYKTTSAEERYLKLLHDRPELVQRVPQYQLASYLGIKPESLSRIRKRLAGK